MSEEYKVTISLEEYRELIEARNECDNLMDFIFNNAELLNPSEDRLFIDNVSLENYLKSTWSYNYYKRVNELKKKIG